MENLFHELVSQMGKALAQELLKTKQKQVKLVPLQPTAEIPIFEEKIIDELSENQQNPHPFTKEEYFEFIETFPHYKDYSFEEMKNEKIIDLRYEGIFDLSIFKNLIQLKEINFYGNQIINISPLEKLVNLKWLYLGRNQITDISPLKNLANLEKLNLSNNPISEQQIKELQEALPNCKISFNKY